MTELKRQLSEALPPLSAQCDPALQAFYARLTSRGKPHKVARVKVMRKLLALLGALLRDDRLWTPEAPPAGSPA